MRRQWNSILLCLVFTVCLASRGNAGVWQDDFNGDTLSEGWEYIDPDAANESEVTDGSFVIDFKGKHDIWGGFDHAPKLLREAPEGDFAIESHFVIQPDAAAGLANSWTGIIIFDDTDNPSTDFLYVARGNGSVIGFEYVENGKGKSSTSHTTEALEVWARIEKTGNTYLCRYKLAEGDGWTDLGEYTPASLNPLKVGVFAKSWADRSIVHSFDYFKMEGANVIGGLASNPSPTNGATDVLQRGLTLNWTPGDFAVQHDVYLGLSRDDVRDASRDNPLNVLVSQGQATSTYEPPVPFEYGQTYYWRVDEVSAAPDNTIFRGDVWSLAVEPFAYTLEAGSMTATASSAKNTSEGPENAIDGSGLDDDDLHSLAVADMWRTTTGDADPWILFAFAEPFELHEMLVWNHNSEVEPDMGIGIREAKVEYSLDGTNWTSLGTMEFAQATAQADYAANTTVAFDGAVAQYVKVTPISNWGGILTQYGLSEVRFLYIPAMARNAEPADGAVDVSVDSDLAWRSGREAATHNVYWGTNPAALTLLDSVDQAICELDSLDLDTTYYWRIDEVNETDAVSVWEGHTWSFTTEEFLVVDDFEGYTDDMDAGEAIFQSWLDGMESATTYGGSQVGYINSPFAEKFIVHGGRQSMPLFYDNTSATFSETTLSLSQDWTASAVKSLSLWFRGASGNTGQLYAKINGVKVVYDGDAGDIALATGWLPWNIDLSSLGVDVSGIKSLTLGVAGTGSGVVYIDDIRLYPRTPEYSTPVAPDAANLVAYYALDGNAKDSSGNGYDGQQSGDPTYEVGVQGQAILVDGIDDFIDLGKPSDWPAGRSPRSLCLWVMTSTIASGWRAPVAYGTAGTSKGMSFTQNGTTLYGAGYGDDLVAPNFWEVDVWYHICLTYDGTTARLYGNGIEVAAGEKTWNLVINRARIGRQINDLPEFWAGRIDEVRLYDQALTAEEVAWLVGKRGSMPKAF